MPPPHSILTYFRRRPGKAAAITAPSSTNAALAGSGTWMINFGANGKFVVASLTPRV
jgi:hypothetical protein